MSNRKRKKIVLLIVEGGSDEALLMERLKEKFTKNRIQFRPYNGDILFDKNNRNKLIKNVIGNFVTDYQKRNKLMKSDILTVLHLIDTDGVFIENDAVQICLEQTKKTFYETERICVDSEQQKKEIERRNKIRAKNIYTMRTCTTIAGIPYQMYYFSRHLEHVIFDEMNPEQKDKLENIDNFIDELLIPVEEFLKDYIPIELPENISYDEAYCKTWSFIDENNHSLQRATNVPLLFDFLQIIIEREEIL